jgi:molybdopterin-guanine dinucleotide biosynthesis protein A
MKTMTHGERNICSIILCGGGARRMGGIQKALLEIEGVPLIERIVSAIAHLGPILISANGEHDLFRQYGDVVADALPDQGPLAGIAACLQRTSAELILVVPGDCPDYSADLAEQLLTTLSNAAADVMASCAHDGRHQQHLHLALRPQALEHLQRYLADGGRSVRGWLDSVPVAVCNAANHSAAFVDIDIPEDLRARQSSAPSESSSDNHKRSR